MRYTKRLGLLAVTAAVTAGIAAVPAFAQNATPKLKSQSIRIVIKDVTTPEGFGPAFVGPGGIGAKTLFTVHAGRPVVLTIVNSSSTMHTLTAKSLGLNAIITVGSTSHVTFTPKKTGSFAWLCTPPCGEYVMATDGYMKGLIKVAK